MILSRAEKKAAARAAAFGMSEKVNVTLRAYPDLRREYCAMKNKNPCAAL